MTKLREAPPQSPINPVIDILHGVAVADPYRWLEDQNSPQTHAWLRSQMRFAHSYLDAIPGRDAIRSRVRDFLAVDTCDSVLIAGNRYVFRKRVAVQEQACIYLRQGSAGPDQLLLNPAEMGKDKFTAVRPLHLSQDGRLLLYEVKHGGERMGTFAVLDIETRKTLPDILPRGYLRGFSFTPDGQSFYYVHEPDAGARPNYRAAYRHLLGTSFCEDREIFFAGEDGKLRLQMIPGEGQLGFLVYRFFDKTYTDFYLWPLDSELPPVRWIDSADYLFGPWLLDNGRVIAITNLNAPSLRIVEAFPRDGEPLELVDLVPACDHLIQNWIVTRDRILVSYLEKFKTRIVVFDLDGGRVGELPIEGSDTVRITGCSTRSDEVFFEQESFTRPIQIWRYSLHDGEMRLWSQRPVPFDTSGYSHKQVWFTAKDGTQVPMFLVGRRELLDGGPYPAIMTSYGGYGVSMTPQFSVFAAILMERGCLFALPNIRGGSEFGAPWHDAAKRRNRQVAFDDFIGATEWLIASGRTESCKLAIFGGSNSGLLVGAAMTQRPDLFRAVVCMAPLLDMLRYHLFDGAYVWKDEFGTADDPEDFAALAAYSPYHRVQQGVAYPATMIVSGDADQNCNPLHARKMTARLQHANPSGLPVILDYRSFRGHTPVLPLSERIDGLTDRLAFLCHQLGLAES